MRNLWSDVRYALRMLVKSPGFAAVTLLTLALGIGANTAIFSLVYGVLLRPLPYPQPEQLVWWWEKQPDLETAPFSAPDFLDYQQQNQSFAQVTSVRALGFVLSGGGPAERVRGAVVSANFFDTLGVKPGLGRWFSPEDGRAGAARVAVLDYGFWQSRFGGDPQILGRVLVLNEQPVTVIGVTAPGFRFLRETHVWLNPRNIVPEVFPAFTGDYLTMRGMHYLWVFGRLKPGVSLSQAQADVDTVNARLHKEQSATVGHFVRLLPYHQRVTGQMHSVLLLLLGAVGFVLLIACANVANLLLARATGRRRELSVRLALGAGPGRLARQLLTESVLLAAVGGALGLAVAQGGMRLLVTASPPGTPRLDEVQLDFTVLLFALGVSVLTGLLFGLAPALSAARTNLSDALKEGGRSDTAGRQRNRLRALLVVGEVALSLILLAGAGLLLRSFFHVLAVNPGFQTDNLLSMWVNFTGQKYAQPGRTTAFIEQLRLRLEALPGMDSVALANDLPLEGQETTGGPTIEGRPAPPPEEEVLVGQHVVTPGFFRTLGIPLLRGRDFTERDAANALAVAIINESMAGKFWPNEDPVGKRFTLFSSGLTEVVGVVADVKQNGLAEGPSLDAYAPLAQNPWAYATIVLRTQADRSSVTSQVRSAVYELDPDLAVYGIRSMEQVVSGSLATRRTPLVLLGLFAGLALVLAAVGLYGVMSYTVTQRTHEIGIRMALGAQGGDVLRMVVRQGMLLVAGGLALGLAGSIWLTRLVRTMLFGVTATDPATFTGVAAVLLLVALAACLIPARRATRVDPLTALRYE